MTFAIAWKGLIFFLILSLLYPILKGGGSNRKTQRGSLWFCPNEFDHQKKVKQKKNVAKSAKIQVILGGVLPPIMNYVVLNRRRNKKRQVLRWIALRKNFARLVFSLYLMEFLLSNAADDGMVEYSVEITEVSSHTFLAKNS